MNYEYSKMNRFTTPHTYMYTKYEGQDFLKAYFEFRRGCLEKFEYKLDEAEKTNNSLNFSFSEFRNKLDPFLEVYGQEGKVDLVAVDNFFTKIQSRKTIQTTVFFKQIANLMLNCKRDNLNVFYEILSTFIKKYEVFKKIYSEYSPQFRKKGEDYTSLSHYILISFCTLYYHHHIPNLKFLNGALKINDAICSVLEKVTSVEDSLFFHLTLLMEKEAIEQLIKKKAVNL